MNALDTILVFTKHYGMGDGDHNDIAIDIEGMLYMFMRKEPAVESDLRWPYSFTVLAQTVLRAKMLLARRVLVNNNKVRDGTYD